MIEEGLEGSSCLKEGDHSSWKEGNGQVSHVWRTAEQIRQRRSKAQGM